MTNFEDILWLFNSSSKNRNIVRLNLWEAGLLYKYAKLANKGILEIGRKFGGSTTVLASAKKDHVELVSVDLAKKEVIACLDILNNTPNTTLLQANSRKLELGNKLFDFAFIDGDHTYEGVKADFFNNLKYFTPDANVMFHDSLQDNFGVWKLLKELTESNKVKELERKESMCVVKLL